MKVTRLRQKATDKCITEVIEYSSLSEFYDYIMNTPVNVKHLLERLNRLN